LTVGKPPIVQDLQQSIPHVRVCLFDLVKQDDAIGAPPNGFGQLTALIISYIARRCAEQPADRVLLAVLAHVDADERILVVKEEPG
jgi:hypothetical protein